MSGLRKVQDDFEVVREKMLKKTSSFQGGAARIYRLYQKFQTDRFRTEGSSEGASWPDIREPYKTYKKSRFGGGPKRGGGTWKSYPGSGTKLMIATGTLAGAVIGPGAPFNSVGVSKHRVQFLSHSMEVRVEESGDNAEGKKFNYAAFANEERNVMDFSDEHIDQMKKELVKFLFD